MRYVLPFLLCIIGVSHAQTPTNTIQTFEGTIGGKYPVSLTLTTGNDIAYGTLVYKKSGKPIRVVGALGTDRIYLQEFDNESTITGIFNGTLTTTSTYSGSWFAPLKNTNMTFVLKQTSQQPAPSPAPVNPTGTYAYNYGKDSGNGQIYVQQQANGKMLMAMGSTTSGPGYNLAIVEKKTFVVKNNQVVFSPDNYPKCRIKVTLFAGGAVVEYIGEEYECGFGHNASVVGNYIKTNSKKPAFPDY